MAKESAPALDDVRTQHDGDTAASRADSPKRQGDKLGVAAATSATEAASEAVAGDSPKPHGDKLEHAVASAAKK